MAQTSSISNTGTYFTVNGMFDEFTGAPVVDTSLQLWLDAGQTSSYSGTGNTWSDLSVSGNVLTLTSGPTFASTGGGGSIVFDGVDDYASGSVSPVFTGNAPHSIDLWFYLTSYSAGRSWILQLGSYTGGSEHWILSSATSTQWGVFGGAQISPNIPLNTWINIITTFDGTTYTCYKNGVSVGSTAATFNFTGNILYLGLKLSGEFNMTGSIASCKLYSRALTGAEVVQNYNALSGRFGLAPVTSTQMPVIKRETSNAVILTNGSFDEFTGAPVVDTNLMVWLDAGQAASYSGTGATWSDLSVNAKNYTLNNSPTFNTTFGGGALTFSGASSQYASAATTLFNSTTINQYSVSIWVYPTGAGQMVSVNGQSTPNTSYHYSAMEITAAGLIYFGQWAPGMTTVATSSQNLNAWYNLVLTYNGTTATAYVNGVSVGSNTIGWSAPGASTFFAIMSQDGTNMTGTTAYASGSVGAFSVYNRALTAAEIVQNYNALSGRYNKTAITTTQMPVVKRETSTGIILVNGIFDEYTGILSPGLFKTTYAGYFSDNVSFFASATPTTYGTNPATSVQTSVITDASSDDGSNFSCQWLGYFIPSTTETHTFYLTSDDASYLWLGDTAITGFTTANSLVNNGGLHGNAEANGSITLTSGTKYPVRIQFGEAGGGDVMILSYATPTITKSSNVIGKVFYNELTSGI